MVIFIDFVNEILMSSQWTIESRIAHMASSFVIFSHYNALGTTTVASMIFDTFEKLYKLNENAHNQIHKQSTYILCVPWLAYHK